MNLGTMMTLVLTVAALAAAVAARNGSTVVIPPALLKNINEAAQGDTNILLYALLCVHKFECNKFVCIFFAFLFTVRGEEKAQEARREPLREVLPRVQQLRSTTRPQRM